MYDYEILAQDHKLDTVRDVKSSTGGYLYVPKAWRGEQVLCLFHPTDHTTHTPDNPDDPEQLEGHCDTFAWYKASIGGSAARIHTPDETTGDEILVIRNPLRMTFTQGGGS